jgi:uncharacterized protein
MRLKLAGETVVLSAHRALFRPSTRQLLVADPHFGKAEVFRAQGLPVPEGTTADNLVRLDRLIGEFAPRELVFLGDFLHARVTEVFTWLLPWRRSHAALPMRLVRGNHDARAGALPAALDIRVDAELVEAPFVYRHAPGASPRGLTLAGHLHPAYRLRGRRRESLRLACFWLTPSGMVLPAFGDFTGCMEIARRARERVFVIAGEAIYEA